MSRDKAKTLSLGMLLGILPSIGLAWAFATTAADHQLKPHLADAGAKVHLMCVLAEWQARSVEAQCAALEAKCPARPPELHPMVLAKACDGGE